MPKFRVLALLVGAAFAMMLPQAPAQAQATRTWVSGVGDDANPCSRTAPCKTFAGAISKTAPGGEIDALDPGGFGALTITKSITIDGGGGQVASVLVAGTNGIVVAAGGTDVVILRNMRFDGLRGGGNAHAGLSGIRFLSGAKLIVDHCWVFGFNTHGIDIATTAAGSFVGINDTFIDNAGKTGVIVESTAATQVVLENVQARGNNFGLGVTVGNTAMVNNSVFANGVGGGIAVDSGGTVGLANTDIVFNGTGIVGATQSYLNNRIFGNTTPGTAPTAASPGQQ